MKRAAAPLYSSPRIAKDFAKVMKVEHTTKSVTLVGRKAVSDLLAEISRAGRKSSRATVIYR